MNFELNTDGGYNVRAKTNKKKPALDGDGRGASEGVWKRSSKLLGA